METAVADAAAATCSIVVEVTFDCLLEIRKEKERKGTQMKTLTMVSDGDVRGAQIA